MNKQLSRLNHHLFHSQAPNNIIDQTLSQTTMSQLFRVGLATLILFNHWIECRAIFLVKSKAFKFIFIDSCKIFLSLPRTSSLRFGFLIVMASFKSAYKFLMTTDPCTSTVWSNWEAVWHLSIAYCYLLEASGGSCHVSVP